MPEISERHKVMAGRSANDIYRAAHKALYTKPWDKKRDLDHEVLIKAFKDALRKLGFNSLGEYFAASREVKAQDMGFASYQDFLQNATGEQIDIFDGMGYG